MEKIDFKNYPDTSTPLSADNLNLLQTNIENAINDMKKSLYSVGDLFMTTNEEDPNIKFGGTWQKLTDDAYLKIVTSDAGKTGGTSSNHKIPISSMPSHNHQLQMNSNSGSSGWAVHTANESHWSNSSEFVRSTGDGNAYYPWYLGVYVWIKTAN